MNAFRTRWSLTPAVLVGAVVGVVLSARPANAGPLEDFYALEGEMAEAQESRAEAVHALYEKEGEKAREAIEQLSDVRPAILNRMDVLTDRQVGKDDGAFMAMASFGWSWNLDVDLPNLLSRFDRVVRYFPNEPQLVDVFPDALNAALALGKPALWAESIARAVKLTRVKDIKAMALLTLGQLHLATQKPAEATSALKRLIAMSPGKDITTSAKGYLYEVEHLQNGMIAPNFTTKTLGGKEVSLKSLRGNVVLLDFWATWCGPCMAEIPHLKEAAKKLSGKAFKILAVSLDDEKAMLTAAIKQRKIPGVQTWDSTEWDDHPVRKLYNVQQLPTWYLIDARGIIRGRDPMGDKLIPAIEAVLPPSKSAARTARP